MTAIAATDRIDIARWLVSGLVVLGLHAGGAALLMRSHEPVFGDEGPAAIIVDLAPFAPPQSESRQDLAPGPEEQTIGQPPEPPREKGEEQPKVEPPPPVPAPEVTLPREETKPEPKPTPQQVAPTPTAPPRQRTASAAAVRSWHVGIVKQIERHKGYSASALSRRQTGMVQIAFTLNRDGQVLGSRVVKSSGHAALDQEAIATLRRAQPFPAPPRDLDGSTFDFTVPVNFNIK